MAQIVRRVVSLVLFLVDRWGVEETVAFFKQGSKKHKKKRYHIGDGCKKMHMHIKETIFAAFSTEMIPLSIEYQ